MRRTLAALTCAAIAAATATSARAATIPQGGGADNVVLAQTTADGSSLVRSSTQISQVGGTTVASSNIATATATDCTGCHSTAVAVQIVFVVGSPQYFVPANAASAVNGGCTGCGSFAYAWQYIVQTDAPLYLSPAAQQQVRTLKDELAAAADSVVPDTLDDDLALQAKLDALTAALKDVVDTQAQLAGVQASTNVHEQVDRSPAG